MKRRIISMLLAILLVLTAFIPFVQAASYEDQKKDLQEKVDETKEEKQEVQEEKKDTLSQIEELDDSISKYELELADLQDDISTLQSNISKKNKEIDALQKDYEKKQELLKDRLVAIYEEGQITFLDVMLSAESVWDYISLGSRIEQLTEADNKKMDEVEKQWKEVEKAKKSLEEEKTKLDTAKKTAQATQKQLQVTKSSKQTQVAKLTATEKKLQAKIEEYNKEIKSIDAKIREQAKKAQNVYSGSFSGTLGWPLSSSSSGYNVITSRFGSRTSPVAGASSNHRGVDIGVSIGTPVYASGDGYVLSVQRTSARGIFVLIKHANNLYTRYQHLSSYSVSVGQYVKRGQLIAKSGNTGVGSGPHLHFEVLYAPYYGCEMNPLTCGYVSVPSLR